MFIELYGMDSGDMSYALFESFVGA
jgi:hypothetical protein